MPQGVKGFSIWLQWFLCSGRAIQFCWPFRPSGKADSKVSPLEASLPCCEMWNAMLSATEVGGALDEVSDSCQEQCVPVAMKSCAVRAP